MPAHEAKPISTLAIEVFGDYLGRVEAGEGLAFEALRSRHPELVHELDELHAQHLRLQDTGLFVTPAPADSQSPGAQELEAVLARLAGREASYKRYRIRNELGHGGMGTVLRVFDRDLRRELAMKVLRRSVGRRGSPGFDAVRAGRLLDEAQITAQLDHPGIPPVHEVGLAPDGELFFTMKLISGARTLESVIEEHHQAAKAGTDTEWSLPRLLGLVQRASEAVAFAHERGVIHRDLKPANILIGTFGEVYVTDWGVARLLGREPERATVSPVRPAKRVRSFRNDRRRSSTETPLGTLAGWTVGTPEYMSPEQARGELAELDRRADVYSMGALLYHVLAGRPPFTRPPSNEERRSQAAFGTPRPIRELAPGIAPELEAIVERAMAREREQRYADMQALAKDLRAFLENRVVAAYRTGPAAELRQWVRRNRGFAGAIAGGVALLLVVLGTSASLVRARAKALAGERAEAARGIQLAFGFVSRGDAHAREQLEKIPQEQRHWEWRHLWSRADSSLVCFTGHEDRVFAVLAAPSGDWVITASDDGTWRKWNPRTGEELCRSKPAGDAIRALALSPDGSLLAALGKKKLTLWDADSGEPVPDFPTKVAADGARQRSLAFAPDGSAFVTLAGDGRIRIWSLDGTLEADWPSGLVEGIVAWSGEEILLAGYTVAGSITVLDPVTGEHLRSWAVPSEVLYAFAVDEVHRRVAVGSLDGAVRVYGLDTGELQLSFPDHTDAVLGLAFDRSGSWLASGSLDRSVRVRNLETGMQSAALAGHTDAVHGVTWVTAANGAPLVVTSSADRAARTWDPVQEQGITRLVGHNAMRTVAFSPDGRMVAAGSDSYLIQVWNADEALALATLHGHGNRIQDLVWTPDGSTLVSASADSTLRVWNVDEVAGVPLGKHEAEVNAVVLDPTGTSAFSASTDGTVRRWDLATRTETAVLHRGSDALTTLVRSDDGQVLLAGTQAGAVVVLDPEGHRATRQVHATDAPITCIALAPNSRLLAIGSEDGSITLRELDAPSGLELSHSGPVRGLAFTPDGLRLLSTAEDRTFVISDLEGQMLASFQAPTTPVDLALAPDGGRAATVHFDNVLRLWEGEPVGTLEVARLRAREVSRRLAERVTELFDRHIHTQGVLDSVATLQDLTADERRIARALAAGRVNDSAAKAQVALERVFRRTSRAEYESARRWIETATQEDPGNPRWRLIHGAVLARLDEHERSLEWLPSDASQDPLPEMRLACQALRVKALCAVGRRDEARAVAESLRVFVARKLDWNKNLIVHDLMREVEAWLAEGGGDR
jgi:WD40 repeat protein/serine/threonine protein kinase